MVRLQLLVNLGRKYMQTHAARSYVDITESKLSLTSPDALHISVWSN